MARKKKLKRKVKELKADKDYLIFQYNQARDMIYTQIAKNKEVIQENKELKSEVDRLTKRLRIRAGDAGMSKTETAVLNELLTRYGYGRGTIEERLRVVLGKLSNLEEAQSDFNTEIERLQLENKQLMAKKIGIIDYAKKFHEIYGSDFVYVKSENRWYRRLYFDGYIGLNNTDIVNDITKFLKMLGNKKAIEFDGKNTSSWNRCQCYFSILRNIEEHLKVYHDYDKIKGKFKIVELARSS